MQFHIRRASQIVLRYDWWYVYSWSFMVRAMHIIKGMAFFSTWMFSLLVVGYHLYRASKECLRVLFTKLDIFMNARRSTIRLKEGFLRTTSSLSYRICWKNASIFLNIGRKGRCCQGLVFHLSGYVEKCFRVIKGLKIIVISCSCSFFLRYVLYGMWDEEGFRFVSELLLKLWWITLNYLRTCFQVQPALNFDFQPSIFTLAHRRYLSRLARTEESISQE